MGSVFEEIDDRLGQWIRRQKMFFVATAPSGDEGLINCSPKGGDSFAILGSREVAYADFGGSGIETVAHVRQNSRIVLMFCAVEGPPKILRLHGEGEVIEPQSVAFEALRNEFPPQPVYRNIIRINVTRISDSCGYGVPRYDYVGERTATQNYLADKSWDFWEAGVAEKNAESLDGLPGLSSAWRGAPGAALKKE